MDLNVFLIEGDMSMGFGGGDFKPHMFTVNKGEVYL